MPSNSKSILVRVYQDVLCPWCYVAERRLEEVRREFGDAVRWSSRPYPLRLQEELPTPRETREQVEDLLLARREREGGALSPDLWLSPDPPRSSVPALAALEAARLQGPDARTALARGMQAAALEQGVNVTRRDVVFELAARIGLQMNRFSAAFGAPQTFRLIREEHRLASSRGVRGLPTLVIADRWMVSGLREATEYRDHILGSMTQLERLSPSNRERLLH